MSIISALLRAEHDLAFLHGSSATDRPDLLPNLVNGTLPSGEKIHWVIDHAETLRMIRDALEAIGVSSDTCRECDRCRTRLLDSRP